MIYRSPDRVYPSVITGDYFSFISYRTYPVICYDKLCVCARIIIITSARGQCRQIGSSSWRGWSATPRHHRRHRLQKRVQALSHSPRGGNRLCRMSGLSRYGRRARQLDQFDRQYAIHGVDEGRYRHFANIDRLQYI